jgi:Family of unknown function (DUF5985)
MVTFLYGAAAMGCAVIGLFFWRFWRQSLDRLFLMFALAFWILAIDRTLLGLFALATEWRVYVFMFRLLAFCLILYGIFEKNRTRGRFS